MTARWQKTAVLLVLIVAGLLAGPAPQAQAAFISTQQEVNMGRDYAKKIEKQFGLVDDWRLQERVARIGARIAAVCDRRDIAYTIKVLNCPEVNAISLPGGYVYLFKGLVDAMPSDDELAGIIGHEVGHIAKRHMVQQMEKNTLVGLAAILVGSPDYMMLKSLVYSAVMEGYSRADEREADKYGFIYTLKAGYNPYALEVGLEKLNERDNPDNYDLFSSHPDPQSRLALIQGQMTAAGIRPRVVMDGKLARITDDGLNLPPLAATYQGYKPFYRACLAAGRLYQVSQRPDFSGDQFILDNGDPYITIFYNDQAIITLTPQDAAASSTDLSDLAYRYVSALKDWADGRPRQRPAR